MNTSILRTSVANSIVTSEHTEVINDSFSYKEYYQNGDTTGNATDRFYWKVEGY